MSTTPRPTARQPWPLWPIAVAILVALVGYTYLRLAYAKPAKPHEPFAEHRQRAEFGRFAAAGWAHTAAEFEAVVELPALDAAVQQQPAPPGPAEELRQLATETWHLPIEYSVVAAPARHAAGADYTVHYQADLDQARAHIVGFDLFRKGDELVALPRWEQSPGALTQRRPRTTGRFTIPAGTLPTGRYRLTLPALKRSSQWAFVVEADS